MGFIIVPNNGTIKTINRSNEKPIEKIKFEDRGVGDNE